MMLAYFIALPCILVSVFCFLLGLITALAQGTEKGNTWIWLNLLGLFAYVFAFVTTVFL